MRFGPFRSSFGRGRRKKKPLPVGQGLFSKKCRTLNQPPQDPDPQEPELQPPPPTGLVEVMEKPER